MLALVKFLFRLIVFWLLYFLFFRIVFLCSQFDNAIKITFIETFKIFYKGFWLDISTICYLITLPLLLFIFQSLIKSTCPKKINLFFNVFLVFVLTGLGLANIIVYKEWGTLFNARALHYATQPKEVLASLTTFRLIFSVSSWLLIFIGFTYIFKKYVNTFFLSYSKKTMAFMHFTALSPLLFLGIRGGWQVIPINESSAYFSTKPMLNHIATNNVWYLGHNLLQSKITKENPYKYFDDATATQLVEKLFTKNNDSTIYVVNIDEKIKPNVVIIILESWSADIIEALGGDKNVTPNFNNLKKDGILFSNIYSSGFRTDQGIVSILSGFPAQPNNSIIHYPEKTRKLPSLIREFKIRNYQTSFYYGGEIAFANMNSYLLNSGCNQLITKQDFNKAAMSNKWGAYDEFVLNKQARDLVNEKEPFFSVLLTLSTHEPFDIPIKNPFGDNNEPNKFRGAAYYTDECLGKYFEEVKSEPWFNNTLFILLADHGHPLPRQHAYEDPLARRMTMMLYGNLIKPEFKGKIISTLANQNDITSTLLAQLKFDHRNFKWSNNIFNSKRKDFAYISLDYGFSWLTSAGNYIYRFDFGLSEIPGHLDNAKPDDLKNGKSYLQCLYKEFLEY